MRRRLAQKKVGGGTKGGLLCWTPHLSFLKAPKPTGRLRLRSLTPAACPPAPSPPPPPQVAQLRREAAKLRELTAQRDGLAAERQELAAALAAAVQRAERAEAEVATLRVGSAGACLPGCLAGGVNVHALRGLWATVPALGLLLVLPSVLQPACTAPAPL